MVLLDYVDPDEVDERTRELLQSDAEYYDQPSLFARALANNPDVLAVRGDYHRSLVIDGDLENRFGELVYLAVSVTNDCSYCVASHREQLVEQVGMSTEEVDAIATGDRSPFSARERAVIAFAEQVAHDPNGVDEGDLEALRDAGFDDSEVVRLLTVAAAGIAANTIADALGIHPSDRPEPFP